MTSSTTATPQVSSEPQLLFVQGAEQRRLALDHVPFSIGRKTDKDLVIPDSRVSRDHALIELEDGQYFVVDQGSKHGTYVNGLKVDKHRLQPNDRVEFGARDIAYLVFAPDKAASSSAREFLSQISGIRAVTGSSDLEKLTLFLEAARKLNTTGVLDEILVTLIESTLRLTRAERGYVFLKDADGKLRLEVGRNSKGEPLSDDTVISRSILEEAATSASEFVVSDTSASSDMAGRNSIIAYDLRTVICIPLRKTAVGGRSTKEANGLQASEIRGVLYLDSRFASHDISAVSNDILRAIATEAAALVENAHLVQSEEAARRYQQELDIAASIQQRLLTVHIPEVEFASVRATNLACKDVGGDFFDVVMTPSGLALVVADVSGKGISAALLASILQGMIYAQLVINVPLKEIAAAANRFLCQRIKGEKYATLLVARLQQDGTLEYANCGHLSPLIVHRGQVRKAEGGNVPIGLLPGAPFESLETKLEPGARLIMVTDGVTEAADEHDEFFGDDRLEQAVLAASPFDEIFDQVRAFCGGVPLNDDCTVMELTFRG